MERADLGIHRGCTSRGRLALEIRGQDTQLEEPVWYHQCNPIPTEHELQIGGEHASYLLLPVIES